MGTDEREICNNKVTTMLHKIMEEHTISKIDEYLANGGGALIACKICSETLQKDVFVPESFKDFHNLCVHVECETKFKKN